MTEIPEELKQAHEATRRAQAECVRLQRELNAANDRFFKAKAASERLWDEFHGQVRGQIEEVTGTGPELYGEGT